jgi:hypothetical protein
MISFVPEQADVLDRAVRAMLDRLAARSALISLFSAVSNEPVAAPATTATGSPVTLQITSQVAGICTATTVPPPSLQVPRRC